MESRWFAGTLSRATWHDGCATPGERSRVILYLYETELWMHVEPASPEQTCLVVRRDGQMRRLDGLRSRLWTTAELLSGFARRGKLFLLPLMVVLLLGSVLLLLTEAFPVFAPFVYAVF